MTKRVVPHRHRLVVPVLVALVATNLAAAQLDGGTPLILELQVVESGHATLCPVASTGGEFGSEVAKLADQVRAEISSGPSGSIMIQALNRLIFGRLGIRGSQNLKDPCNLLPSGVLDRRQGYCVGIAALYLLLAERLDLPIYAVATPSHVFLRYDDKTTRINIETLQGGTSVPDDQYIREQKIPEVSIRRGVFMRNLTTNEFLGQVHNNLGVIYSEEGSYENAAAEYQQALVLDPRLPAAYYNYGNDLLRAAKYRLAVRLFSKSLRLYPTDVWALNNRGLAHLKMGRQNKARLDFNAALRIDPGFQQARLNLERMKGGQ